MLWMRIGYVNNMLYKTFLSISLKLLKLVAYQKPWGIETYPNMY